MAAEQLRMVALGASPGNAQTEIVKLRSSDGRMSDWQISVAAPQLSWKKVTLTCGFTAGYLTPLLRSESQINHQSAVALVDWFAVFSANHSNP